MFGNALKVRLMYDEYVIGSDCICNEIFLLFNNLSKKINYFSKKNLLIFQTFILLKPLSYTVL